MTKYEAALVFQPNLDEDALIAGLERVKEFIARAGGVIEHIDNWGKRKLAYEIKKLHEGFYYFIKFEAPESAPAEMEQRLRIREDLLRYLVTRREELPPKPAAKAPIAEEAVTAAETEEAEAETAAAEPAEIIAG